MEGTSKYEIREVLLDMKSERAFFVQKIMERQGEMNQSVRAPPYVGRQQSKIIFNNRKEFNL